ncbi:DUF3631 domain-containing protein [Micromonospora sp. NPDC005087]|uniref:DUF3631 domain-containing protein n=1 Tax=Micromonospora sp. NPDC005087 TaxID=3364225 RepID=UPI0036C44C38
MPTSVEEMEGALRAIGVDPAEDDDIEMQFFVHHREEIQEHRATAARREREEPAVDDDPSSAEGMPEVEEPGASGGIPVREPKPPKTSPPRPFVPGAGARVLDEVEALIRRYVILPNEEAYVAVTLWAAATHGMPAWEHATRLVVISAVKGCGKTRLFEVLQPLSEEPLSVSAATTSAITRSLEGVVRTVFHDEADTVFGPKAGSGVEKLRGIYNAGFQPGAGVLMSERDGEEGWTPRMFEVFAMVALASKGVELPDTIMDRAVVIRMRKKLPSETVGNFRQKHIPEIRALGRKLGEWVGTVPKDVEPETPLQNREADLWEPLLILADAAGGEWPTRARKAAVGLTEAEDGIAEEDRSLDLLRDIKRLWPKENGKHVPVIATVDLLGILHDDEESSWDRHDHGRQITNRQLADLLRGFAIAPTTIKVKQKSFKGYRLEWFKGVSARYLDQ